MLGYVDYFHGASLLTSRVYEVEIRIQTQSLIQDCRVSSGGAPPEDEFTDFPGPWG